MPVCSRMLYFDMLDTSEATSAAVMLSVPQSGLHLSAHHVAGRLQLVNAGADGAAQ